MAHAGTRGSKDALGGKARLYEAGVECRCEAEVSRSKAAATSSMINGLSPTAVKLARQNPL
jgi:hypothetical protein